MANILKFNKRAASETSNSKQKMPQETVVFPGVDLRKVGAGLDYWKRTGKSYDRSSN